MSKASTELIPTRASLINRLKDLEDQSGWQEFFDTYWKLVYGVARKAGLSDAEAQDVVQEVMASVAKDMPTFKFDPARGSFKSWLLIKTRWKIVSQFREREPRARMEGVDDSNGTQSDPIQRLADPASLVPDAIWETEWQESLFAAAFANVKPKLDPEKSQIFDFYAMKGWKAEKVSTIFRVPIEHVYMVKHRVTESIEAEVRRLERETT